MTDGRLYSLRTGEINWEVKLTAEQFARWFFAPKPAVAQIKEVEERMAIYEHNGSARAFADVVGEAWMYIGSKKPKNK